MKHRFIVIFTSLLILGSLLLVNPQTRIYTVEVYAMPPQEEAEYFRGPNYQAWTYPNGTTLWESTSQYVWNGSTWVPYIVNNTYASNGYISIQAGLIGAECHKGKIVYYDPNMTTLAVGRENWLVFQKVDDNWKPVCASLEKYFDAMFLTEESEYVNVTATWATPKGTLTITYHFEENLKHTVNFDPIDDGQYAVAQIWNNTQYEKVRLTNAMIIKKNDNVVVGKTDALTVLFHNDVQPFGIMEDQTSAKDKFKYVIFAGGTVNYQGFSITDAVAWIFGTWTLNSNETLTIDPTTSTFTSTSHDGHIEASSWTETSGTVEATIQAIKVGYYAGSYCRGFLFFDTSSLPDDGTIISATLSLYGVGKDADPPDYLGVQNGQPTYPHDPLESGDFNSAYYSGDGGSFYIPSWTTTWNDITLNEDGRSWINKTGTTKQCLRTKDDIDGYANSTYVQFWCYEKSIYRPKLSITYWTSETTVYSSLKDGVVHESASNWDAVHDDTKGSTVVDSDSKDSSAMYASYSTGTYQLCRAFFYFDTSFLEGAEIVTVDFKGYRYTESGGKVSAMKGTQHDTLTLDDFDAFEGSEYGWAWWNLDYCTISFNAQGISDINRTGITKICCREREHDYLDVAPDASYHNGVYFSEESGTSKDPKLVIHYTQPLSMGEFEAPSTVYAQQYIFVNATINHDDGVANFVNATLELSNSVVLKWDKATDTFSEHSDPQNYCTLNSSACQRTSVNSTAYKLSWNLKLNWTYPDGPIDIVKTNTKVYDSNDLWKSGSTTDLFTFEDDLIMVSASVRPTKCNALAELAFAGTVHYEGTSTPPYNTTGITINVELDDSVQGSTTTIDSNGNWSLTLKAPNVPERTCDYIVYAETDEASVENKTLTVVIEYVGSQWSGPIPPVTPRKLHLGAPLYYPPVTPEPMLQYGLIGIGAIVVFMAIVGLVSHYAKPISRKAMFKAKLNAKRNRRAKPSAYRKRRKK